MPTNSEDHYQEPYEMIAEQIIEGLQHGECLWTKPWQAGELAMPVNAVTGAPYRGVNTVQLLAEGLADPRFCTLKQANSAGWRVGKGEKARPIIFWKNTASQPELDKEGNPVYDENGVPKVNTVELERPICHIVHVFHVSQLEGNIPPYAPDKPLWDANERVETMLNNSSVNISHDQRDRAFYSMQRDEIHLPPKENFADASLYYATALHELGHATGHPKRLYRTNAPFGSPDYAKEELRAEIASFMLSASLGVAFNPDRHQAYINEWIEVLQNDPYEVIRACRDAEKMKEYIMGWEQQKEKEVHLTGTPEQERAHKIAHVKDETLQLAREVINLTAWDNLNSGPGVIVTQMDKQYRQDSRESLRLRAEQLGKIPLFDTCTTLINEYAMLTNEIFHNENSTTFDPTKNSDLKRRRDECGEHWKTLLYRLEKEAEEAKDNAVALSQAKPEKIATEKIYLAVAFAEKEQAKKLGAQWDIDKKCWYAPSGTDLTPLSRWLQERRPSPMAQSVLSPEMEFAERLKVAGLVVDGAPIMDGQMHRVPIEGRPHAKDGTYRGNLDGRPAGWFQNFVTGETDAWRYSGHTLTQEELASVKAEAAQKQQEAERTRQELQERAAKRSYAIWKSSNEWATSHPYLEKKGVRGYGVKVDAQNNLIIPLRDVDGHIHSLQNILPDGQKRFERGGQKAGHFHVIDPGKQFGQGPIIIAEGYATAATVHEVTGLPVVCAFDGSNLLPVAQNLRDKYPEIPFVFMADNDLHVAGNPGLTKAKLAANAVGGTVYAPAFSKEELVGKLSDWNDLCAKHGVAGVEQQLFAPGTNKEFGKPLYQASAPARETAKEQVKTQPLAMAQGMER